MVVFGHVYCTSVQHNSPCKPINHQRTKIDISVHINSHHARNNDFENKMPALISRILCKSGHFSHHMHPGDYPLPQTYLIHMAFPDWSVFQILVHRLLTYSRYIYIYLFILLFPLYNRHGLKSNPEPFEQKSCLLTAVCIAYWAQVCTLTEFRSKAANRVTDIQTYIGRCVDRAQDAGWETAVGIAIRYRVSGSGVRTPLWAGDFILSTPV